MQWTYVRCVSFNKKSQKINQFSFKFFCRYSDYPTEEKEASEKEVTTKSSETKSSKQTKHTDGSKSKTN